MTAWIRMRRCAWLSRRAANVAHRRRNGAAALTANDRHAIATTAVVASVKPTDVDTRDDPCSYHRSGRVSISMYFSLGWQNGQDAHSGSPTCPPDRPRLCCGLS